MQDTLINPPPGLAAPPRAAGGDRPVPPPRRLGDTLFRVLDVVLALAFIGAVLLNFANVFGRYVLGHSMIGAEEVQTYIMVAMTFLGAAGVAWRGRELRMDVLVNRLPGRARGGLRDAERALLIVCCAFTAWQSGRYATQMFQLDVHSDGAGIPMWLPHGAVALGLGLIALVAVVREVQRLRGHAPADQDQRVLH